MKKILTVLLPVLLLVSACGKKEKLPGDPCSFMVRVDKVGGTKVWFTITPDNPNAYYTFGLVNSYADGFDDSPSEMAAMQIKWMNDVYGNLDIQGQNLGSFADVFLYTGTRELKETTLAEDTDHKLFVMQVDPDKRTIIGETAMIPFRTKQVEKTGLSFELKFSADKLEIIPSDDRLSYFWDYDDTAVIEEEYYTPSMYFYYLTDMYEEYDFMDHMVNAGPCEWVFSRDDNTLDEGDLCTLAIGGYADGEINTAVTIVDFIYHRDRPIEAFYRDN